MMYYSARRQILRSLGLVILIILLIALFVDFDALMEVIRSTDWVEYGLAVGFLLIAYAIYTLRTRYLLQNRVGYLDALAIDGGGFMFGVLFSIPTDVFRVVAMNRSDKVDPSVTGSALTIGAITSMLVRMMGLLFAIVFGAASSRDATRPLLSSLLTVVILLVLLFVLAKNAQRIRPYLARVLGWIPRVSVERTERSSAGISNTLQEIASFRRFGMSLFLRILIWVFSLLFYFYAFESMNIELTTPHLLIPLSIMVVVPPTSPMMIGVFHGAVIAILGTLGIMGTNDAAAYAVTIHFVQMVILIILGFIGLRRLDLKFSTILKEIRARARRDSEAQTETVTAEEAKPSGVDG